MPSVVSWTFNYFALELLGALTWRTSTGLAVQDPEGDASPADLCRQIQYACLCLQLAFQEDSHLQVPIEKEKTRGKTYLRICDRKLLLQLW